MDPLYYFLIVPGLVLVVAGLYAVFKLNAEGETELEWMGFKLKTTVHGLALVGLGLVVTVPAVQQAVKKELLVTDVTLLTEHGQTSESWPVSCPITIGFLGSISVTGDSGTVSYRFDRQIGINTPIIEGEVRTLAFDSPGTASVRDNWTINIPVGEYTYRTWLQVVDPGTRQSEPVRVDVLCDPDLPELPPTLPPDVSDPPG